MSNALFPLRRLAPVALLALCLGSFGSAAQAQMTAMTAFDPSMQVVPAGDWQILNDQAYDYTDLKLAKTLGYTDSERATIAKIARLTGLPFKLILNQVHEGRTFAWLASDYGLNLNDVLDASDEQARIDEYLRLYWLLHSTSVFSDTMLTSGAAVSGESLSDLEAHFNQLSAAFPALPPTNIETAPVVTEDNTVIAPPPAIPAPTPAPVEAAPAPAAKPAAVKVASSHAIRHRRHVVRHIVRRARKPAYLSHMGS